MGHALAASTDKIVPVLNHARHGTTRTQKMGCPRPWSLKTQWVYVKKSLLFRVLEIERWLAGERELLLLAGREEGNRLTRILAKPEGKSIFDGDSFANLGASNRTRFWMGPGATQHRSILGGGVAGAAHEGESKI